MSGDFALTLATAILAGFVSTAGVLAVRCNEAWARQNAGDLSSFAAGVLISVSFLYLVPSALFMNSRAPTFLLAGYFALYASNRIFARVCNTPEHGSYAIGLVPLLGIGFHSLVDGMVYSVGFNISVYTGALMAIGMVLHEFPEGAVMFTLLLRGGFSRSRSLMLAILASAITTPLGTLISYPFVASLERGPLGALLGLSAGALIYVGATHLLPLTEHETSRYRLSALASGVAVAIAVVLSHPLPV